MTVNPNDVIRCSARMTYLFGTNDQVGVFHYRSDGPAETDPQTMLNLAIVIENLYIQVNADVHAGFEYEEISFKNLTQNTILGNTPWPTLTFGALAAQALPSQVTALVIGVTGVPLVQGRKYVGGFTEDDNVDSALSGGLLANLANFAAQYILPKTQGGIGYTPFIRQVALPNTLHPLIGSKVISVFRTQRRRTRGFGS